MNSFENQYTLIGKIGEGGMGTVYVANDTMLDRKVAIKQLKKSSTEDDGLTDRFQQEALALAKLNHPNITHLYSFIPKEDTYWMVMEYVEGKTLEEWIKIHGKLSYVLAASIVVQMLEGLQHAHKKGIIHRDIKPANAIVNEDGEVKVMDFGIARMRNAQRMTRHGKSVGTLEYMSPEQIQGKEGDERTDIYAVAILFYELLCGTPPFQADTDYQTMKDKLEKDPIPIHELNQSVPHSIQSIISTALERKPEQRYSSTGDFKAAIELALGKALLSHADVIKYLESSQMAEGVSDIKKGTSSSLLSSINANSKHWLATIKKHSLKPFGLLAASLLLCIGLLIWNFSDDTSKEKQDSTSQGVLQVDNASDIVYEPSDKNNNSTSSNSLDESPNEMYQRISKQQNSDESNNKTQENTTSKKETPIKKKPKEIVEEENEPKAERNKIEERNYTSQGPVEVPAGKSIRVVLSETISSENPDQDGSFITLTCAESVEVKGRIIIKKGALVVGKIVDVIPSSNSRKKALIGFVIHKVRAVDGSEVKLRSERFRLFADQPGTAVSYKAGQSFTATLGRGQVR